MQRFERMIALGAVPLMVITEVCMASSLLLPNAAQLAGRWQLYPEYQPAQACELRLGASGGELSGDLACAERLLGLRPGSWLVTPDTLALVGADGSQAVHFSRQGAGHYALITANGTHLVLDRQD
ncbi:AprI/Inh family metalloprotease inhibitor [Pseudomonas sp. CC120222-01a]|uniref:AprI/Inh family metalloprotease inhibitor n=1 Tax=Pseudomonas sp. CC120222-01a TaxID=1378075 RepID=UPI000D8F0FD3|nr:AprI/Inh family metalloprotease inhibitor [Pseudomonas sp. CC120222-01a]PVZ39526.1 protease inhibitor Inh [Pseudomonas sp. CC120222-01a]